MAEAHQVFRLGLELVGNRCCKHLTWHYQGLAIRCFDAFAIQEHTPVTLQGLLAVALFGSPHATSQASIHLVREPVEAEASSK